MPMTVDGNAHAEEKIDRSAERKDSSGCDAFCKRKRGEREHGHKGARGESEKGGGQAITFNAVQMSRNVAMSSGLSLHRWPIGSLVNNGGDVDVCVVEGVYVDDGALVCLLNLGKKVDIGLLKSLDVDDLALTWRALLRLLWGGKMGCQCAQWDKASMCRLTGVERLWGLT